MKITIYKKSCHSEHIHCVQCKLREESRIELRDSSSLPHIDYVLDPFGMTS